MTLALSPAELKIVRDVLTAHLPPGAKIWVFGSRAVGKPKPYSDLDLMVDAGRALTLNEAADLRDAFSESDLPWKVDVVDRRLASSEFLEKIAPAAVLL